MSVLMRPTLYPMLFRQENAKLLKYIGGGTKNLEFSKVNHARFIVSDQCSQDDIPEINALIDLYSKREAPHVFNHMTGGHFQTLEAVRLFKSMVSDRDESCPPNNYVSGLVLSSCLNVGHLILGRQCHGYLLKSGLVLNQYVKTALVRLYSMLSDVVGAMKVLLCNRGLDTHSYNLILVGLVEKGYLDEALVILRRMWEKATYIGSFDLCARLNDLNLGRQVHNKLLKSDDGESDESVCSAMINMYGKCGEISSANKVFVRFEHRNVVIWTTFLAAYLEQGSFAEPLMFFFNMQREDVVPNESTFCVLLNASAGIFSNRLGRSFHALAVKTGFKGHKNVEDALINMYSRTGDIKAAEKVFLGMTDRDIVTWNAMICGYCHHGLGKKSLALFQEMLRLGVDPDYVSFVGVLSACGQVGLVDEGFYYLYELMKEKGVEPGLEHYTCILNMLIKAGQLSEALSFILLTPSKWDVYAWTTLLSGCRAHGNNTLGIRVAELIPDDVATKVSKLCGVTEVRELMEIRDIKEERGPSWVEIEDRTYQFDSVHKGGPIFAMSDLYMKTFLKTIQCFYKMPNDEVEEAMKRDHDGYLSEEITVAFTLFETHVKAPIFVIKTSGKISAQCHSLMRLISKVTVRLIMVRDAHFLHRFEDGLCSCQEYW